MEMTANFNPHSTQESVEYIKGELFMECEQK